MHGVWDPMPELTITSSYVDSRVGSNTFTMGNLVPESTLIYVRVDFIARSGTKIWPLFSLQYDAGLCHPPPGPHLAFYLSNYEL
jgi:hypothetical protein